MAAYSEERVLPFSPKALFDLVADIEAYPEFLPWCHAARILSREGNVVIAELVIRFKAFTERYTSRVLLDPERFDIAVELVQGPFKHLYNGWRFSRVPEGTRVEFDIDFELRSRSLQLMLGFLLERAYHQMVESFESRAWEKCARLIV